MIPVRLQQHTALLCLILLHLLSELLGNCGEEGVPDLVSVLRNIASENIPNLPPGGGLASK